MCHENSPLTRLALADPGLASEFEFPLAAAHVSIHHDDLELIVNDTLWALSQENAFGKAVAKGYARLIANAAPPCITTFRDIIKKAGKQGPTEGKLMATYLVPVLESRDPKLFGGFMDACRIMRRKGTYTLKGPMDQLSRLLAEGDTISARVFLDLLCHAYDRELSYNRSLQLTATLPRAVAAMTPGKRSWQIKSLSRLMQIDLSAAECFILGLKRGLNFLSHKALDGFVSQALKRYRRKPEQGCRFLSLESQASREICGSMQVAVPLFQIQRRLSRYVRTRTGRPIHIKTAHEFPPEDPSDEADIVRVYSDEHAVYLPAEIDVLDDKKGNQDLYMSLAKLESAHIEFGTFDFDADKTLARTNTAFLVEGCNHGTSQLSPDSTGTEIERFINLFDSPKLAADLFYTFEHGRLRYLLRQHYPGIIRQSFPHMQREMIKICQQKKSRHFLNFIYAVIALDMAPHKMEGLSASRIHRILELRDRVMNEIENHPAVETCGALVCLTYRDIVRHLESDIRAEDKGNGWPALRIPFGRRFKPGYRFHVDARLDRLARTIQSKLKKEGLTVFRMDVRKKLAQSNGRLSPQDLEHLVLEAQPHTPKELTFKDRLTRELPCLDISDLYEEFPDMTDAVSPQHGRAFTYHEWDCRLGDYLPDHVRVADRTVDGVDGDFYMKTLNRHHGLIQRMRHAFELLKPDGLSLMRQWLEGDQFDYRALIDFAIDRRAGRTPLDRLYIRRDKRQRDVAVLVLIDLSKSTANLASGSASRVLDIEKEAVVLLSEALAVVDDKFALAGFSGSGRLGVDYLRIKDFPEPLDQSVHRRINAIAPLRSTRMGAAIRHATQELAGIPARVRLLLVVTDGFPNDVGYKQGYAVADTRRAVFEAHAQHVFFKAIVVNIVGDPDLDALYGKFHHSLISDLKELPDKLLRIYGAMTRM